MTELAKVVLVIGNLSCGHCVRAVTNALRAVDGVADAEVTLDPPRALVTYDPDRTGVESLRKATADEGYPSSVAG